MSFVDDPRSGYGFLDEIGFIIFGIVLLFFGYFNDSHQIKAN